MSKPRRYTELTHSEQVDMIQEYQESYYQKNTIEDIDEAFTRVNPSVIINNGKFDCWEISRKLFEKELRDISKKHSKKTMSPDKQPLPEAEMVDIPDALAEKIKCHSLAFMRNLKEALAFQMGASWVFNTLAPETAALQSRLIAAEKEIESLKQERDTVKGYLSERLAYLIKTESESIAKLDELKGGTPDRKIQWMIVNELGLRKQEVRDALNKYL